MAFNKYKDGAWQEPESGVKRYADGAWTDCESAKRYKDGAWTEVWSGDTNIYYVKNGALANGASTTAGNFFSVYDSVSTSGSNLVVTCNITTWTYPSKINLPKSLHNYSGQTLVLEGSFPSNSMITLYYWYSATSSGSWQTTQISVYSSKTSASITIPSTLYSGSDKPPYIRVVGNSSGTQVKFSNIYIAN